MASWIITKDLISDDGRYLGEWNGNKEYIDSGKCKHKFRLLDDDMEVYFEGLSGNSSSFSPLDDFGMPGFGCTTIEYMEGRKWTSL